MCTILHYNVASLLQMFIYSLCSQNTGVTYLENALFIICDKNVFSEFVEIWEIYGITYLFS
jgi:hypothetical protein